METNKENDELWRKLCELKYKDICSSAYMKAVPGVRWFNIFWSLTLWADIANARMTVKEVFLNKDDEESIVHTQILRDGYIGVLNHDVIEYYSLDNLVQLQDLTITYHINIGYIENEDTVLIHKETFQLLVKRKKNGTVFVIHDVQMFLILENHIYYVSLNNGVYVCNINNGIYTTTVLLENNTTVLAIGHENGIPHIMIEDENNFTTVFKYDSNALTTVFSKGCSVEKFQALGKYFANHINWMITTNQFNFFTKHDLEFPQVEHIQLLRTYGPVLFAGYSPGILCIFHSLYTTSVTDLLLSKPSKVYCLLDPHKGVTECTILNIDVVEGIDNHTVLVVMSHKVLAIRFSYALTTMKWLHCIEKSTIPQIVNNFTCDRIESTSNKAPLSRNGKLKTSCGMPTENSGEQETNIKKQRFNNNLELPTSRRETSPRCQELSPRNQEASSSSVGSSNSGQPLPKLQRR